tara:strand:- start:3109 stop:3561 length:453 start_codon:yes stop_codon:yes gene_type:complete
MAIFSLHTGLRQSNVKNLRWNQVNWDARTVVFHPNEVKSGKYLNIPLSKTAFQLLVNIYGEQNQSSEYVFTYKNKPITQVSTKAWRKALIRANIHDFRWHDLRHTWASWHIQNGTPLMALKELGGWSSLDMVMKYAHLGQNHLKQYAGNI